MFFTISYKYFSYSIYKSIVCNKLCNFSLIYRLSKSSKKDRS